MDEAKNDFILGRREYQSNVFLPLFIIHSATALPIMSQCQGSIVIKPVNQQSDIATFIIG